MGKKTHGPYLIAAIEHNDHEKVGEILTSHIRPKEKVKEFICSDVKRLASEHTECPLLLAATLPDPSILQYFVKKHGVDINYAKKIPAGRRTKIKTCLIVAVRNGLYDTVEGLLALNADPSIPDHKGRTPLHHAVRKADFRMAKMLLMKSAQANLTDMGDNSPLHVATIFGHTELVKILLHHGADQYKKGQHGALPIHIAAKEGHVSLLELYCLKQVNPNMKMPCYDGREKAPLHVAAEEGHHECITLLLRLGADINCQDSEGETPMTCCVLNEWDPMGMKSKEDYTQCVRILLKKGGDVNLQNGRGESALHLAARNEFHKIVELLIQAGANPLLMDNNDDKPIDLVSPEDTVSRQALKQAQADRERYLNDMLELQAKGYSTSLHHMPTASMNSLNQMQHAASMPGLVNGYPQPGPQPPYGQYPQMQHHPSVSEDSYVMPRNGDQMSQRSSFEDDGQNPYAHIDTDDSYAPSKNDEKSGSKSSLSKILQENPRKNSAPYTQSSSSSSSYYSETPVARKQRSRSVDMLTPKQVESKHSKPHSTQNTPHKKDLPPELPAVRRQPRDSAMTDITAITDATSVWDDTVTPRSSVSTFVPDNQPMPDSRLEELKQSILDKGARYLYTSDSASVYETIPGERIHIPLQGSQNQPAAKLQAPQTEASALSDSDDTFFDDESFDTVSDHLDEKPKLKPKPKPKPKSVDLKKKAMANRQKESKVKTPSKKNDPALENWLSEQAQILKERNVEEKVIPVAQSTPPTGKKDKPIVKDETSPVVDNSSSPGVKHRIHAFQKQGSPAAPSRPIETSRNVPKNIPVKTRPVPAQRKNRADTPVSADSATASEDEEKVVHLEVDDKSSPGQTLIRLIPVKGSSGVAHLELPSHARNVHIVDDTASEISTAVTDTTMESASTLRTDDTFLGEKNNNKVQRKVFRPQPPSLPPPPPPPQKQPAPEPASSEYSTDGDSTFDDELEGDGYDEDKPVAVPVVKPPVHAPRTPNKTIPITVPQEEDKRQLSTFMPVATSTLKHEEEPLPPPRADNVPENVERDESSSSGSEESSYESEEEEEKQPEYAIVNKNRPAATSNVATVSVNQQAHVIAPPKSVQSAAVAYNTSSVGQVHVVPMAGQVHAAPVVGQVHQVPVSAAKAVHSPQVNSSVEGETSEEIYHEIDEDVNKRKSVSIGNNEYIPTNVKPAVDFDHRRVSYNSMGLIPFKLVGGNADGVFVHNLVPDSPAHRAGMMNGDQLIKVNEFNLKGKTKEEVTQLLTSMKATVNIVVRHKRDRYQRLCENGGMGDSFFVRAHFIYNDPNSGEMAINEGDIFGVRDTMPEGRIGSWQALKVNASTSENQHGLIPNKRRAEQVAISRRLAAAKAKEQQKRGGLLRRSFGRSKSVDRLNKSRDGEKDLDINLRDIVAYEYVQQKTPDYKQPVILLGLFCDAARDMLGEEYPGLFVTPEAEVEIPSKNTEKGTTELVNMNLLKEIVNENKHCLAIVSPKAIQYMQQSSIKPMVIYLHPGNKTILKAVKEKLAPTFTRKVGLMLDEAAGFEKLNSHLFTAKVTYTTDDSWFSLLKDTIHRIQNQPHWISAPEPTVQSSSDEALDSPMMNSRRKINASCDDIPNQITNILDRHATGPQRVLRSESSSSTQDDPGIKPPPQSSLTYDGYFLSNDKQEPAAQQPASPTSEQPPIEVTSHQPAGQRPRSILKNGAFMSGDDASMNSSSSSSAAPGPEPKTPQSAVPQAALHGQPGAVPMNATSPLRQSSPNSTPPRPLGPPGPQPHMFRPRQAPIQMYNRPPGYGPGGPVQMPPRGPPGAHGPPQPGYHMQQPPNVRTPQPQGQAQGMHPGLHSGMHPAMAGNQPPRQQVGMHPAMGGRHPVPQQQQRPMMQQQQRFPAQGGRPPMQVYQNRPPMQMQRPAYSRPQGQMMAPHHPPTQVPQQQQQQRRPSMPRQNTETML